MINNALNLLRRVKHAATPGVKGCLLGTSSPSVGLIVIGAQKSGTTSLYKYLSEHPDIDVPLAKELDYFNTENMLILRNLARILNYALCGQVLQIFYNALLN